MLPGGGGGVAESALSGGAVFCNLELAMCQDEY